MKLNNHISRVTVLACIATLCCFNVEAKKSIADSNTKKLELWYNRPAAYWEEALPIGNGRLGAMVSGTVACDTVQINVDSFWSGSPYMNYNGLCMPHLKEMRALIAEGTTESYIRAQKLAMKYIIADKSTTGHGMAYESVGRLLIYSKHYGVKNYRRSLNLENATVNVSYECDGITYSRTYFTSFIDKLIFIRFEARKNGKIINPKNLVTPELTFIAPQKRVAVSVVNNEEKSLITAKSTLKDSLMENIPNKLDCTTLISKLQDDNGITVVISSASSFDGFNSPPADSHEKAAYFMDNFKKKLDQTFIPTTAYRNYYEKALYDHAWKYKKQFNRVSLELGADSLQEMKDTETRIREFSTYNNDPKKASDPSLITLYFQFGRYLLISSSQPKTQAANLQGIWNPDAGKYPAWDSKYTTNINLEMNYWPSEVTNLSECNEPLFNLIKEVSMTGKFTAKHMYGMRGWMMHHNTDIWRATGAVDYHIAGVWPTAGAWLCSHLWEHYLYTGDKAFLATYYPIMKNASRFFQDYLYKDSLSGYMVAGPSVSPENNPGIASYVDEKGKKQNCAVFSGITMDNQLIYDLFRSTAIAARTLHLDGDLADSLDILKAQLPPMQIGRYGQLQEWLQDWDKEKTNHRHISHLWGAFPGAMVNPYTQPYLFAAVHKSLSGRGDESRGWSMAWKVCQWARQQDGNHALILLKNQLRLKDPNADMHEDQNGGTYANMFDAHPPFQIDGNLGCCAGIAEMLVQSYDGSLHILPALPDEWKAYGNVKGLKCHGGFEIVELEWKNGHINHIIIKSTLGGNLRIRTHERIVGLERVKVQNPNNPSLFKTKYNFHNLNEAVGKNSNPLMQEYDIPDPVIKDASKVIPVSLPNTLVYDFPTEKDGTYEFVSLYSKF